MSNPITLWLVMSCLLTPQFYGVFANNSAQRVEPSNLGALFAELQELEHARTIPTTQERALDRLKREKELEGDFSKHGAEGITFLLAKLSDINAREKSAVTGPDDVEGGLRFLMSEAEAGRTGLVRYAICYMLSDMYSFADAGQREQILRGIVNSYLPSTHGREDIETMDGSLFRLGKVGVMGFLMLADSPSEFNRCHAALVLQGLAKDSPHIDCKSEETSRAESINVLREWWRTKSSEVRWPNFPGYFDVPSK